MKKIILPICCAIIFIKSFSQNPAACYSKTPEWDKVITLKEKIVKTRFLQQNKKDELLNRFKDLKEVEDDYYNGTSEWCIKFDEFQQQNKLYIKDVTDQNTEAKLQHADANDYNSQCAGKLNESQYKFCVTWKAKVDAWEQRINDWKTKLDNWLESLNATAKELNQKGDRINAELKENYNEFIKDAEEALTSLPPEAGELVSALNKAASAVNPDKNLDPEKQELNCNKYFRALGKYFNASGNEWTDYSLNANQIADKIINNTSGNWKKIVGTENQITEYSQKSANNGVIVIGIKKGVKHGHIAIVSPIPPGLDLNKFGSKGPMVRDGNVHENNEKIYPGAWGTIRASQAFDYTAPPSWYIWVPSMK